MPAYDGAGSGSERRRSLLGRLRRGREGAARRLGAPDARDELDGQAWSPAQELEPSRRPPRRRRPARRTPSPAPLRARPTASRRVREPRHVRAIPTSGEQKTASAVEMFNASEHPRTVAGVARSLGVPTVSVLPSSGRPSLVNVVVSWELCWYRYEVDLSEELPSVRVAGQGYELDELPRRSVGERLVDEPGALALIDR